MENKTYRDIFFKPEPLMTQLIINWAQNLPNSSGGVLDLAAGPGVDVSSLLSAGVHASGQDQDPQAISHATAPINLGQAENLSAFPDSHFSGLILKYAWAFLNPSQREQLMTETKRTLVTNGQLLIVSEQTPMHLARFTDQDGETPIEDTDRIVFERILKSYYHRPRITQYSCMPEEIKELAENYRFDVNLELIPKYIPGNGIGGTIVHPLVREARFPNGQSNLFIATLTKI